MRLRPLARRLADLFPFTPLGLLLGTVGAFALERYGFARLDLVVLVLGLGVAGLLAVCLLLTLLATLVLKLRFRPPGEPAGLELETGRPTRTHVHLPRARFLPLLELRFSWLRPKEAEVGVDASRGRPRELVTLSKRGEWETIERRIEVRDVFGLTALAFRSSESTPLRARPHLGALGRPPILSSLASGDETPHPLGIEAGDRVELRRYAPGDPARFIHWKAFSRTRKLMVRMPERALSRAHRVAAYLVAGEGDEASAAAARLAVEEHALGAEWVFGADGSPAPTADAGVALRAIIRSVAHRERGASDLAAFLRKVEKEGPVALVLFVPPVEGPWLSEVRRALSTRAPRARVVVGVDGIARPVERSLPRRLLFRAPKADGFPMKTVEQTLASLGARSSAAMVFDRKTGRVVSGGVLRRPSAGRAA